MGGATGVAQMDAQVELPADTKEANAPFVAFAGLVEWCCYWGRLDSERRCSHRCQGRLS